MIFDLFFFSRWCFTFYQDKIHYCTGTIALFFSSRVWTNLPMWIFSCSKFSWPRCPWPKKSRLSFWLTNSRVRYKSNVEKSISAERCRQLWTSRLRDCQFMKSFRVWGWLLPFWWRVNLSQVWTSFNGNSLEKPQLICQCIKWCILYSDDLQSVLYGHLRWFLVGMFFCLYRKAKLKWSRNII